MWGAQFVSNIGSWMQTVAAQWLMLTLTSSAAYVALVQTAASLPVLLFAVLAGTIGDLVDRRRFMLITQPQFSAGSNRSLLSFQFLSRRPRCDPRTVHRLVLARAPHERGDFSALSAEKSPRCFCASRRPRRTRPPDLPA
jgi:MFS family permease